MLLALLFVPLFLSYRASKAHGNRGEVKRCILENDHQKLHKLLKKEANRRHVNYYDVSKAMRRGHLEVIQEICVYDDISKTITEGGVREAIDNGHLHIVKYILDTPSLQNIIFECMWLLRKISDNSELMRACMTDGVVLSLLRCNDDVLEHIESISELRQHICAWIVCHLSRTQSMEEAKMWNRLAWRLVDKSDMNKLLKESSVEKLVSIMECDGTAETFGSAVFLHMMSTEDRKELLKDMFMENKHSKLREIFARYIKAGRRSTYIKFVTLMLENGEDASGSSEHLSYGDICDLRMDSIASKRDRAVIERLGSVSALNSSDLLSIYKQILFRRKVHADRDAFRQLSQNELEKLHECFCKEESETEIELVARRLQRQDEQVPLSIHVFCMMYDEYNGRYRKSDGLIRNILYGNSCDMCRKELINKKPIEEDDTDEPVCPVCENDYDASAECSKLEYKALPCGHVYHSSCLKDWMESVNFDNECPSESCQKPVLPGLSDDDIGEMRRKNLVRTQVLEIQRMANNCVHKTMNDPQNIEAILHNTRFSYTARLEVERLLYLMGLDLILKTNIKELKCMSIYEEVKRELRFNEQELFRLQFKYPWIS